MSPRTLGAGLAAAATLLAVASAQATPPRGDAPGVLQQLVLRGAPVFCGGDRSSLVALTFDDGPSPWTTRLTAALRRAHAPSTFFLVGSRIGSWPAGARADARTGALGNHTWSHPHLPHLSDEDVTRELRQTQLEILRVTGEIPVVFRPPYGEADQRIDVIARSLGLLDVRWSVETGDAAPNASPAVVVRRVLSQAGPGSIVLLHDSHAWTASIVPEIVRGLRARGLRPVTLPTLLEHDPPARALTGHRC